MDFSVQKGVQRRYERIQGIIGVIIIGLLCLFNGLTPGCRRPLVTRKPRSQLREIRLQRLSIKFAVISLKRSGTPAPNDPKTTQKRSRLRPENGASKSGNESLCPSLGVATAERTRRRKSQKMPLPELRRALTEL